MRLEQALIDLDEQSRVLASSPGFLEAWRPELHRLCVGFGPCPAGVACPLALFVQPLGRKQVVVARVRDQGSDRLRFHLLILSRHDYYQLGGDPFLLAESFPVDWQRTGDLPTLEWTFGPPPYRTVDEVRKVLDVVPERTQTLLGGIQALLDGGKLVFRRDQPDPAMVRDLWALLPYASRAEFWPATFAFSNALQFHVVVVPDDTGPEFASYIREADAGDYPEGRYELALHLAAERSDQAEIDGLFARRSRNQMVRLALWILAAFLILPPLVLRSGCDLPFQPPP